MFSGQRLAPPARERVVLLVLFVLLCAAAVVRARNWTYGADTGTFVQLILDVPHGMHDALENGTHFRYHDSPTLVLLWPLLAAIPNLLTLQIVQVVATLATAPLVRALIAPYVVHRIAARIELMVLLYPPLLALGFNEFHEVGLLAPLAVGFFLAADRRRWRWFALCTVLLCGLREDVCLIVAIAGATFALAGTPRGRSRELAIAGAAAAVLGLAVDGVYYGLVVPRLGGWVPAHFYVYPFANGPAALLLAFATHPLDVARALLTLGRLTYLLEALVPLAFLPLRSPWSLLALPGLAIVLLANTGLVWRMGMHYSALWIPWLVVGAAFGTVALAHRAPGLALRATTIATAISIVVLIGFNPMHPLHYLKPNYHDLDAARAAIACVPPDEAFATHDEWYTAVAAQRPLATVGTTSGLEYLVYADDFDNAGFVAHVVPLLQAEVAAGHYRVACTFGNVHTYARLQ